MSDDMRLTGKKIIVGVVMGAFFGIIDVLPLIITWKKPLLIVGDFLFKIILGYLIATVSIPKEPITRGVLISIMITVPALMAADIPSILIRAIALGATIIYGILIGVGVGTVDRAERRKQRKAASATNQ